MIQTVTRYCALVFVAAPLGCRNAEASHDVPPPRSDSVVVVAAAKLSSLSVASVGMRTERLVANLAAQLVPDEDHTVRISSPVTGRISALDAVLGSPVGPGSPLAR
ncbi:MAG TPA: hypothetical protein VN927_04645, partial [Gemmatimonadaceae bacterium]|nr:hypothetical protein [Gemmatimonadaceae bacterium]